VLDDNLTRQLRVLGLSRLGARLYRALLSAPAVAFADPAGALADPAGTPAGSGGALAGPAGAHAAGPLAAPAGGLADLAARVDEIDLDSVEATMHELAELGLISTKASDHRPIPPAAALTILERRHAARLNEAKVAILQTYDDFRRAAGAQPLDGIEMLDPEQTRLRLEQAMTAARHQIRVFDSPPYFRPEPESPATLSRPGRAVSCRIVYSRDALEWPGRLEDGILPAIESGQQARTLPELPVKLHLVDEAIGFVGLTSHDIDLLSTVLVVHRCSVLTALMGLFETAWQRALPLYPGIDPASAQPLQKGDRLLLALLCAGLSDEASARELGVSRRTYYRRLEMLMTRTGATTRFQLALHATRAGWIS
jgi:DNA-binding CsgD family transcriptional regulator